MKRNIPYVILMLIVMMTSACSDLGEKTIPAPILTGGQTTAPEHTSTPDPCSAENLPGEVSNVHKLTREFDDYSTLASNTPQSQLVTIIPELQRVLRDAEDQRVPACLLDLKKFQLLHMNLVVQTLLAFVSSSNPEGVNAGITKAREAHTQYDIELARLLGLTIVVPTDSVSGQPQATEDPNAETTPSFGSSPFVTNPGPSGVYLRVAPDLNAQEAGALQLNSSAPALGRTEDNIWIQIEIPNQPGQTAWVYASLVQVSVPIDQLPVVTP